MQLQPRTLAFLLANIFIGMVMLGVSASVAPAFAQDEAPLVIENSVNAASEGETVAAAEAHEDIAAVEAEGSEAVGFPQLKTETYASQVFWLFVSFILLFALMAKVALPRVGKTIDSRQNMRENDLSHAQKLQKEAAKIKKDYDASLAEAQSRAQSALSTAEQDISDKTNAENARFADHARKRILTAEQTISRAKTDAMQSLSDISAEIAAEMANKIAGLQMTKADAKKAVAAAMQEGQ